MKMLLLTVLLAVVLASAASAQVYQNDSVIGQVPDRVVITVKDGIKMSLDKSDGIPKVGVESLDALAQRFLVKDMEQLYAGMTGQLKKDASRDRLERVWAVDFPAEEGLDVVKAAYEALPEVEEVRLVDICKEYSFLPNDPDLVGGSQWYLRNMVIGGKDIRAVGAWGNAVGDSNIIIAIIDSGVDIDHPDLGGTHPDKVNGAINTVWAEYYGTPGVDDDGNGKVDDFHGWDFVHTSPSNCEAGQDCLTPDPSPRDFGGHGTNCAGVAAALSNNGTGIAGAAPGCKILPVRVGYLPAGSDIGTIRMDWAAQGIIYAANTGAHVINCSWGSSDYLNGAINTALYNDIVVVNAAGNDASSVSDYLGTRAGVICVAATDDDDGMSWFSNFGTWVEISAPGTEIWTTHYDYTTTSSTYISTQGTSFSSPLVAGAAALIRSAHPEYTYTQVANALYAGADNIDAENPGMSGLLGAGRCNLLRSLDPGDFHTLPDEFPTMFDAMNSAEPGETIAVQGGATISGRTVVFNKELDILGGWDATYSTRDPLGNPAIMEGTASQPTLTFESGTGSTTVVDGFRIEGGGGLTISGIPEFSRAGGGIYVVASSPTLRNLIVTDNGVGNGSTLGCGGGIMVNAGSPVLDGIEIYGNSSIHGGGLYAYNSTITATNCNIHDNIAITDNLSYPARGGGIYLVDSTVDLTDCSVSSHLGNEFGGGIYAVGHVGSSSVTMTGGNIDANEMTTSGGGVYIDGGDLNLTDVTLDGNTASASATFAQGGALYVTGADLTLDGLVVQNSFAHIGGGILIDAIPDGDLMNSLFVSNEAAYAGAGIHVASATALTITGNTVADNNCTGGGGGMMIIGVDATVENNIVAFNTGGGSCNGISVISSTPTFGCNDVFGNDVADYTGIDDPTGTAGNISADPAFCNMAAGNYAINTTSPCAPANSGGCGLIGALASESCSSPVPGDGDAVPTAFKIDQNYPNPFNPSTTIRFSLPTAAPTKVVIYDVAGRVIKTLVDEDLNAQDHEVVWTGRDENERQVAAGVYFYFVSSGEHRAVGRMALVK